MPEDAPRQRVSPVTVPDGDPSLPAPDDAQPRLIRDAFREFGFACGVESRWIGSSLRLQRQIVRESTGSRVSEPSLRGGAAALVRASTRSRWRSGGWLPGRTTRRFRR